MSTPNKDILAALDNAVAEVDYDEGIARLPKEIVQEFFRLDTLRPAFAGIADRYWYWLGL